MRVTLSLLSLLGLLMIPAPASAQPSGTGNRREPERWNGRESR